MKVLLYTVFKDLTTADFVRLLPHEPQFTSAAPSSPDASLGGDLFENTCRKKRLLADGFGLMSRSLEV
jgi:hypothetical protein